MPPELALDIISYIPVHQIPSLRLVDFAWKHFVDVNENHIYRSAAIYHSFASPGSSLDHVIGEKTISTWLGGIASWKVLWRSAYSLRFITLLTSIVHIGKKYVAMERAWTGRSKVSRSVLNRQSYGDVDQFSVDEEQGAVIFTSQFCEPHSYPKTIGLSKCVSI